MVVLPANIRVYEITINIYFVLIMRFFYYISTIRNRFLF